jgi:hypothetical protein
MRADKIVPEIIKKKVIYWLKFLKPRGKRMGPIRTGFTNEKDEAKACQMLADQLQSKEAKLNLVFFSRAYEATEMSHGLYESFGSKTMACSTAGEISSGGFLDNGMVGFALQGDEFEVDIIQINDLRSGTSILGLKDQFERIQNQHLQKFKNGKTFAILLVDGLAGKEEELVGLIDDILKGTPLIGGSASDQLQFESTLVYSEGQLKDNVASLAIVTTTLPFHVFKDQHFCETDNRFAITAATPATRTVQEIEGTPAGEFYAKRLGLGLSDLSPTVFSKNPVMLKVGSDYYVRSIQKMNPDLSLTFYCAIDNGIVLRMASQKHLFESTNNLFHDLDNKLGTDKHCLIFECILRKLEILQLSPEEKQKMVNLYKDNNAVGFHTFGEQFGGVHINQTLTGVAFGTRIKN